MRCLNATQQRFVDLAGELADVFAGRAAEHDRDNTFPYRNYDDLRESGLLALAVPEEMGGLGAGMAEILLVLERLAMGDGATALAVTMHTLPVAQWAGIWRRTGSDRLESMLRAVAEGRMIWSSVTSEMGMPNDLTDARTQAVRVPGGYLVTGRKSFGTNTAVATHCSVTARDEHADGGPLVLFCQVELDQPGVRIHQTWDTLGMRGTQSNDVEFHEVFVPDEAVGHRLPAGHLDARVLRTTWAWALPAFAAVYTGVAAGALDWTVSQLSAKGRQHDPVVQDAIGECQILLETSRALIHRHVDEVRTGRLFDVGVQEGVARCAVVKYVGANNATQVMRRLVDVVGGASYARALPFERMWRDVQAATFMPINNVTARKIVGATAAGVPVAPVSDRR
ncbi:acyl-CoA/acyl-ACP dehydrogenase [Nonomuraea sp. NN258]|uniref:acyl-CoA dehydrogenase family protein n=1 Tax=Nonomuraea antri TaxID=2730852 RepID=UPI0015696429|nr:acyl-CoA dehydrogenase family protein [Nonomuraea antri]NRQ38618.1 acyl-CoA/acyl-ACP dehydrogenase [Nonomuraea antri]